MTGPSNGLGAQLARTRAADRARVVLAARRVERLKELRAEIEAGGGATDVLAPDATDLDAPAAAVTRVESENGPIRVDDEACRRRNGWST